MPMTKYERWSVFMAAAAIVISALSAFKAPLWTFFYGNTPKVFVENKIGVMNRLGSPTLNPIITVANEGTTELTLGRIEGELKFQSGEAVKLSAENYFKGGASFYLREVNVKPGDTWSERPNIMEDLPQNKEEEITKLEQMVWESASKRNASIAASPQKVMIDLYLAMMDEIPDSKTKIDPAARRARITEIANRLDTRRTPVSADPEIVGKAKQLFDRNISRIEKGQHTLLLRLFDRSDKKIWEGIFDFVLYEEQVQKFKTSFDGFGDVYFSEGIANTYRSPVIVTLRARR